LARFLTSSSHFTKKRVKGAAFLPNLKDNETSVSRHGAEPRERLWEIGAAAAKDRTLHGAAILKAKRVREVGLEIVAKEPPLRHAAIHGWPVSEHDPDLAKAQQKQMATAIAQHAEPLFP
jgi:hypothetical protein